ncbi:MAG: hypothetical protein MUC85_05695 [Anaerolineales bacterium]|nr:hypothetical protein [Anaerolineales bacterium]
MENTGSQIPQSPGLQVNEQIIRTNLENLKLEQNLALGILGGCIGGALGAAIWAAVTYFTEYQIGYLAIGVGFLVGFGVGKLGKGIDKIFGVAGAVISLVSVVMGNFLASLGFLAKAMEISYLNVLLNFDYSMTLELMKVAFDVMDLLFYALAIYAGYRFSFRKITREQLLEGAILRKEGS